MTQKTKTLTARIIDNLSKNSTAAAIEQTNRDFKNSLLIVSVGINVFIFTAWLALQVTAAYDSQVASVLLVR
ncbi:hypothetical protein D3C87_1577300 [compost metagenome]